MKEEILANLIQQITVEITALQIAAKSAHSAATHEESRQEDKHDTRSIEASYLAAGTAKRIEELQRVGAVLKNFRLRNFSETNPIAPGALVELKLENLALFYFLLPVGGGYKIAHVGKIVHVITMQSNLGEELLDRRVGDKIEIQAKGTKIYEICRVL